MSKKARCYMFLVTTMVVPNIAMWLNKRLRDACSACVEAHEGVFYANLAVNTVGLACTVYLLWYLLVERRQARP
jgi:uncharacterized membrane protein YedE/YeeE